jgi:hypothetical protein
MGAVQHLHLGQQVAQVLAVLLSVVFQEIVAQLAVVEEANNSTTIFNFNYSDTESNDSVSFINHYSI